jgi:hypothetical protein
MNRALENISATGSVSYHYTLCKLMSQSLFILHACTHHQACSVIPLTVTSRADSQPWPFLSPTAYRAHVS